MEQLNDYLQLAKNHDEHAIRMFYEETINSSYVYAKYLAKNEQDAFDLLQEAYIKAFDHLDQLDKGENFPKWLKRIMANLFYDQCRKQQKESIPLNYDDFSDHYTEDRISFSPNKQVNQDAIAKIVFHILEKLPDEQRICILMYYYDEYSVKEMAEILGCSENTIKSRLNYARKKIKEEVESIERKDGYKLYNIAVIPFFITLFAQKSSEHVVHQETAAALYAEIARHSILISKAVATGVSAAKAGATHSIASSLTKVVLALCLVGGGGTAFYYLHQKKEATKYFKTVQNSFIKKDEKKLNDEEIKEYTMKDSKLADKALNDYINNARDVAFRYPDKDVKHLPKEAKKQLMEEGSGRVIYREPALVWAYPFVKNVWDGYDGKIDNKLTDDSGAHIISVETGYLGNEGRAKIYGGQEIRLQDVGKDHVIYMKYQEKDWFSDQHGMTIPVYYNDYLYNANYTYLKKLYYTPCIVYKVQFDFQNYPDNTIINDGSTTAKRMKNMYVGGDVLEFAMTKTPHGWIVNNVKWQLTQQNLSYKE